MNQIPLHDLLPALDLFVVERDPATWTFSAVTPPPPWWSALPDPTPAGEPTTLAKRFPFLDNFLRDAEAFWDSRAERRLQSGPFVATGSAGDLLLRASAFNLGPHSVLVLEHLEGDTDTRPLLQKARENKLQYEQLARELESVQKPLATIARLAEELLATELTSAQRQCVEGIARDSARHFGTPAAARPTSKGQ